MTNFLTLSNRQLVANNDIITLYFEQIVYKKTDEWQRMTTSDSEWYNDWQRMAMSGTTSGTTNDKEWQRVTTNDKEWQRVIQRVTTSGNKWHWVTVSDSSGTTNENGIVHFKEWMIAVLSMAKTVVK